LLSPSESPPKLAKHAKFRIEKFGGVLFETRSEKVFALNLTAAAIVAGIGAGCDEPGLVARMKERFGDSSAAIEREVLAFMANLRKHGLLEE
jgi:hypothetical protein